MNLMNVLKAYANEESIIVHERDDRTVCEFGRKWEPVMLYVSNTESGNKPNKTHSLSSIVAPPRWLINFYMISCNHVFIISINSVRSEAEKDVPLL